MAQSIGGSALLIARDEHAEQGQVLDLEAQRLYPPFNIQSILARGYWRDYDGPQNAEERIRDVEVVQSVRPSALEHVPPKEA